MLTNVYILYIDDERSKSYKDDCLRSCLAFPNLNPIPVEGFKGATWKYLSSELNVPIIPYYTDGQAHDEKTINGAFSCSAGHYRIWQKIVESGEPGVVLEHDAIVKYDFSSMSPKDNEILWLGPRIDLEHDYNVPSDVEYEYVEIDRFEGTHAYAITPSTAEYLIERFERYGFNDSLDGQLGMRNMFDLNMRTIDPPPVVAVVGNRTSCIENSGNPGFWNAYNTPRFLEHVRPGAKIAPERKLYYTDTSFDHKIPAIKKIIDDFILEDAERNVLLVGASEGRAAVWLSNQLLEHNDSWLHTVGRFRGNLQQIYGFNTYFSKYYFKMNVINTDDVSEFLVQTTSDPDIKFDFIYIDCNNSIDNTLTYACACYSMLNQLGIMILDNANTQWTKSCIDIFSKLTYKEIYRDENISVFRK